MEDLATLQEEIVRFVGAHPGAGTTAVRRGVSARSSRVSAALDELEEEGRLRNDGNGRGHAWHAVDGSTSSGLLPADFRPGLPEKIGGVSVTGWTPPKQTAHYLDTTPRTLQRWEQRGMPACGKGRRKLHPWPHVVVWWSEFELEKQRRAASSPTNLPLSLALARDHAFRVQVGLGGLFDREPSA